MAPQRKRPEMQLQIPQVPHFPLSSPITEEISSPAASSDEDREMERSRPFEYLTNVSDKNPFLEAESTGTGRDRLVEREIGVFDTARRAAQGGKPKGLNLITDLPIGVPKVQTGAAGPAFVDLNDLKVLSKVRERERASQKIRGILKNGMAQGFQRLPDETSEPARRRLSWLTSESTTSRKKKKYKDELSPSDRPIMIGYTVPCEESSQPQDDGRMGLDSAGSQRTPMTPSIVVTPAKDEGFLARTFRVPPCQSHLQYLFSAHVIHRKWQAWNSTSSGHTGVPFRGEGESARRVSTGVCPINKEATLILNRYRV